MSIFQNFDIIHTYTRRQAIEDGVLVDLTPDPTTGPLLKEAGFRWPVAMTIEAFHATICSLAHREGRQDLPAGQSIEGRLWDVLWMLRLAIQAHDEAKLGHCCEVRFLVMVWNGMRHETVELKSICGPGDDLKPVITIMLEGQD